MPRPKKQTEEIKPEVKIEEEVLTNSGSVEELTKQAYSGETCKTCGKPIVNYVVGGGYKFCCDKCLQVEYPDAFGNDM